MSNQHCTSKPWYKCNQTEIMQFHLSASSVTKSAEGLAEWRWYFSCSRTPNWNSVNWHLPCRLGLINKKDTAFLCTSPRLIRPVQLCVHSAGEIIITKTLQVLATQSVFPWKQDVISALPSFYQCNMKGWDEPQHHCCCEYSINWGCLSDFTV